MYYFEHVGRGCVSNAAGERNWSVIVVPIPSSDCMDISPPCRAISCLHMSNPKPLPAADVRAASDEELSNRAMREWLMPIPSSRIVIRSALSLDVC